MQKFQFQIEQIALSIDQSRKNAAMALLADLGMTEWHKDTVVAAGSVGLSPGQTNTAELAFNYQVGGKEKLLELELLNYTEGDNFVRRALAGTEASSIVTHIGMHVTAEQLEEVWRIMQGHGISTSQVVRTQSHTNPVIKDSRRYTYAIFATRDLIGVDLKFIVRKDYKPEGS